MLWNVFFFSNAEMNNLWTPLVCVLFYKIQPENVRQKYIHAQLFLVCLFKVQMSNTAYSPQIISQHLWSPPTLVYFHHCWNRLIKSFTVLITYSTTALEEESRCVSKNWIFKNILYLICMYAFSKSSTIFSVIYSSFIA